MQTLWLLLAILDKTWWWFLIAAFIMLVLPYIDLDDGGQPSRDEAEDDDIRSRNGAIVVGIVYVLFLCIALGTPAVRDWVLQIDYQATTSSVPCLRL